MNIIFIEFCFPDPPEDQWRSRRRGGPPRVRSFHESGGGRRDRVHQGRREEAHRHDRRTRQLRRDAGGQRSDLIRRRCRHSPPLLCILYAVHYFRILFRFQL